MDSLTPIYTPDNSRFAYQLNWAVSFFGRQPLPGPETWLAPLREAVAADGLHLLEGRCPAPDGVQLLASTQPPVSPAFVLQRLKGRLQYLPRDQLPKAFRRNLAYARGMQAIYRYGYYVGTFGNFDLGALRHARNADQASDVADRQ